VKLVYQAHRDRQAHQVQIHIMIVNA
jgi:hypothetical protein